MYFVFFFMAAPRPPRDGKQPQGPSTRHAQSGDNSLTRDDFGGPQHSRQPARR